MSASCPRLGLLTHEPPQAGSREEKPRWQRVLGGKGEGGRHSNPSLQPGIAQVYPRVDQSPNPVLPGWVSLSKPLSSSWISSPVTPTWAWGGARVLRERGVGHGLLPLLSRWLVGFSACPGSEGTSGHLPPVTLGKHLPRSLSHLSSTSCFHPPCLRLLAKEWSSQSQGGPPYSQ